MSFPVALCTFHRNEVFPGIALKNDVFLRIIGISTQGGEKMSDHELLLAISNMMDEKFATELQPIKDDLHSLKEDVQILKVEMKEVKEDVRILKEDVQILKEEVETLKDEVETLKEDVQILKVEMKEVKEDVRILKEDVQILKEEVGTLKEEVETLKENVQTLENKVHQIQLCQENMILPRLNTIESCYTGTYGRYKAYADRMEVAFDDIEMLKKVVAEHSEKLQKLA